MDRHVASHRLRATIRIIISSWQSMRASAAPLGMIEAGADSFAGAIPTILKCNSANSLATEKDQAVTGSVDDALRAGCSAIGFTIYPGSEYQFELMEEIREMSEEAKSVGLAVVVWSYPRGGMVTKEGETAMDVCAYAAHVAADGGAYHQGEAADRRHVPRPGEKSLRRPEHPGEHVDAADRTRRAILL